MKVWSKTSWVYRVRVRVKKNSSFHLLPCRHGCSNNFGPGLFREFEWTGIRQKGDIEEEEVGEDQHVIIRTGQLHIWRSKGLRLDVELLASSICRSRWWTSLLHVWLSRVWWGHCCDFICGDGHMHSMECVRRRDGLAAIYGGVTDWLVLQVFINLYGHTNYATAVISQCMNAWTKGKLFSVLSKRCKKASHSWVWNTRHPLPLIPKPICLFLLL